MKRTSLRLSRLVVALMTVSSVSAQAPVIPVDQEPNHHVMFASPLMRVLEIEIGVGVTTLEHRHDHDLVTINIEGGLTRSRPAGEDWTAPRTRLVGETNVTEYTGNASAHTVQNLHGEFAYTLTGVENLRPSGWTQNAAIVAPATMVVNETRSFRLYDVRFNRTVHSTRHTHSVPVVVTLVSGRVSATSGDAGTMLTRPGQWVVVAAGAPHLLEAAGAGDVRVIEAEVR